MATLSGELGRPMLRSLFHVMFNEPACRPMEATFVQTYQMAATPAPALLYQSAAA
jgi:hypothetical protein